MQNLTTPLIQDCWPEFPGAGHHKADIDWNTH